MVTASASVLSLIFRVGSHRCALPLSEVVEVLRPLPVEALAGAPPGVSGLAIVRGAPIPVVDVAALLGGAGSWTRFVIARAGERKIALAVDAVVGIRALEPSVWNELPPLVHEACSNVVDRLAALDREAVLTLTAATMVPEPVWESLSKRGSDGTVQPI